MLIPWQALEPTTLDNLLQEFVSREGTDYGHHEYSLEEKAQAVKAGLMRKELVIVFDHESDTCDIRLSREYVDMASVMDHE